MAGSKSSISGQDFYGAYDAQEMANKHGPELGMQVSWGKMPLRCQVGALCK